MSASASQLASVIADKKKRRQERAYESFKARCHGETALMIKNLSSSVRVTLQDDDLLVLEEVTEELRDLGYKFKFVEKVDVHSDEVVAHELVISIAHVL